MKGIDELKPFRIKIHSIIKKNHEKLYNKIKNKVGDTMKDKEDYDNLCNQWILLYDENNQNEGNIFNFNW